MMHGREDLFTLVNMLPPMATVLCPQRLEHRTDIGLARGLQISEALKQNASCERQERLEALQGWRWNYVDAAWESGFSHLTMYAAENDDCLVPGSFKSTDGFGLGVWVVSQRTNRNDMPQERIQKLESLRGLELGPTCRYMEPSVLLFERLLDKHRQLSCSSTFEVA